MTPTGNYAKGLAKREQILEVALETIAVEGYDSATLRRLANAVGLSKTGLLHHFGSKEGLYAEILHRRDALGERATEGVPADSEGAADELTETILDAVRENLEAPGLIQLYIRFCAEASDPGHPAHGYFRDRYARLDEFGSRVLRTMQRQGCLPAAAAPERLTVLLTALVDGLQMRSLFDTDLDVVGHLEYLFRLLNAHALEERR